MNFSQIKLTALWAHVHICLQETTQHWALSFLYMWHEKLLPFPLNWIISFGVNWFLHTNITCCYPPSPGYLGFYSSLSDPPPTIHLPRWDFAWVFQVQKPWAIFERSYRFSLHRFQFYYTFSKEKAQDLHLRMYPMLRPRSHVPYAPHAEYKSATRTSRLISPKGLLVQAQALSADSLSINISLSIKCLRFI